MHPLIRPARALWRLGRLLAHLVSGWCTVRLRFARCTPAARERQVQRWAERMLGIAGVRLQVDGEAPATGPVLLVSNHISWLDILVLHAAGYCRFVSKADVRDWPLIGTLATGAGTLYIARESRRDALRVVHRMTERLAAGDVIAIFPEGTTADGVVLLPFHANLLQAAVSAQVPAQPVALRFADAATGQISRAPSFVGDETLLGSVWRTLLADGLVAQVRYGTPEPAAGRERRAWSRALQARVQQLRDESRESA